VLAGKARHAHPKRDSASLATLLEESAPVDVMGTFGVERISITQASGSIGVPARLGVAARRPAAHVLPVIRGRTGLGGALEGGFRRPRPT
jgi:hypothetical protein